MGKGVAVVREIKGSCAVRNPRKIGSYLEKLEQTIANYPENMQRERERIQSEQVEIVFAEVPEAQFGEWQEAEAEK